jgi:hypothetical protein
MRNAALGRLAEEIAAELWPDLRPVEPGSDADLAGQDALTADGRFVQIKADREAERTGNVFWEIAKRNDGRWNTYGGAGAWHMSPSCAHLYVFVALTHAYRVDVEALARVVATRRVAPILTATALGFLVPLAALDEACERRPHPWRMDPD